MLSRIAKVPLVLPKGVTVKIADQKVYIKGPKGELTHDVDASVRLIHEGEEIRIEAVKTSTKTKIVSGTTCAMLRNLVQGVTQGFRRDLQLVGVGYRAQAQGDKLTLTLGFSHPVVFQVPKGVKVSTPSQTDVVIEGADKHLVGQVAANIRRYREPECYKGKGVRYLGEHIELKETKKK